jgi:hypothetical protein
MAKEPRAGFVKTRLARQIGVVAATFFYRHVTHAVTMRLAASTRWQTWLAITPNHAVELPIWPAHVKRRGQQRGNLGQRMQRIMDWPGRGPIVIVGTDIPAIRPDHIAAAFRQLGAADAVFGPTPDGGYWLVGLRRTPRILRPFENVRWSSAHALADTRANLWESDVDQASLLSDVDDEGDWRAVKAWYGRIILPVAPAHDRGEPAPAMRAHERG